MRIEDCGLRIGASGVRNARAEYDAWADTYPAIAHNPVMRAEQALVEPILRRVSPRRALDVGSGSGRYRHLLESIGAHAIGIDFSMRMLTRAEQLRGGNRVCADARQLPIRSQSVDLVNASLMVGDVTDLPAWAGEMSRVLGAGGHLVYSDFHPVWSEYDWRRTFRDAAGVMHELPFEPHTTAQHLDALATAGFVVNTVDEGRLVGRGDHAVRAFRARWGDPAVVVVLHATKR